MTSELESFSDERTWHDTSFPLPPASNEAIVPRTTLRLRNGEAADSECRAEDKKTWPPAPTLDCFFLSFPFCGDNMLCFIYMY